jgi:hypothetical protein
MPANVQLIYYLIQYNFNIQFLNMDFIDFISVFTDDQLPENDSEFEPTRMMSGFLSGRML